MAVVRCVRCERMIDLDWDCTPVTKQELPTLDVPGDFDWVCGECLSTRELDILNGEDK